MKSVCGGLLCVRGSTWRGLGVVHTFGWGTPTFFCSHMLDGRDNAWRSRAPGPQAHGNAARQVVDGLRTEVWVQ